MGRKPLSLKKVSNMTARELREMLFEVSNQNLTVRELRDILFKIENQDQEVNKRELATLTKKAHE